MGGLGVGGDETPRAWAGPWAQLRAGFVLSALSELHGPSRERRRGRAGMAGQQPWVLGARAPSGSPRQPGLISQTGSRPELLKGPHVRSSPRLRPLRAGVCMWWGRGVAPRSLQHLLLGLGDSNAPAPAVCCRSGLDAASVTVIWYFFKA